MTFLALLTKELRLRLRRERTIWIIIAYLLLMSLLGWVTISGANNSIGGYGPSGLSTLGSSLYLLLSLLQLFLILFIVPAFTATTVNSEKERQTFDLLLCSRLSGFSLVAGKLLAGLANAYLLVAASIPLFSLVFFFGGIAPVQVLQAIIVYAVTVLLVGTFGLFCSTIFSRPAISTAITYIACLLWLGFPLLVSYIINSTSLTRWFQVYPNRMRLIYIWNPVTALGSTYPATSAITYSNIYYFSGFGLGSSFTSSFSLGSMRIVPWLVYTLISLAMTVIFFLLSLLLVKPGRKLRSWRERWGTRPLLARGAAKP